MASVGAGTRDRRPGRRRPRREGARRVRGGPGLGGWPAPVTASPSGHLPPPPSRDAASHFLRNTPPPPPPAVPPRRWSGTGTPGLFRVALRPPGRWELGGAGREPPPPGASPSPTPRWGRAGTAVRSDVLGPVSSLGPLHRRRAVKPPLWGGGASDGRTDGGSRRRAPALPSKALPRARGGMEGRRAGAAAPGYCPPLTPLGQGPRLLSRGGGREGKRKGGRETRGSGSAMPATPPGSGISSVSSTPTPHPPGHYFL